MAISIPTSKIGSCNDRARIHACAASVAVAGPLSKPTVLDASLIEGAAEFTATLLTQEVAFRSPYAPPVKARDEEIETEFVADVDKTDLSQWIDNGTLAEPGDLGYWVGYRIVKSYYEHARDKRQALRDVLEMKDPKAFLARSGWYPGIRLQ